MGKKILFDLIKFPEYGGISTVTSQLLPYFINLGYDISVLSHRAPNKVFNGPKSVQIYYTPDSENLNNPINWLYFENLLKNNEYNLIIFQDSYAPIHKMVCSLAAKYGIKLIVVEHNSPRNTLNSRKLKPLFSIKGFVRRFFHPLFVKREIYRKRYILEKCHKYVLLSERYVREFADYIGVSMSDKIVAINNPIDNNHSVDLGKKDNAVLFVGRIMREKGLKKMIRIWKDVSVENYKFIIVGDGPLRVSYEKYVKSNDIKNIFFEGFQNPDKYYKECKVFWMLSEYEGWPMTLLESMSQGCVPIVLDTFSAVYDIIDHGINGFIVKRGQESIKFKEFTELLFDNNELFYQMSSAAMRKIKQFSGEKTMIKWEELLREVDE